MSGSDCERLYRRSCDRHRGSFAFRLTIFGAALTSQIVWHPTPAQAAGLNSLQSGTATMTAGAGSAETVNVTITAVDMTKSVLFFNLLGDSDAPEDGRVRGQLTSSTNIQFYRINNSSLTNLTIKWNVVEFACGVTVQRGLTNSDDTTNVTIDAVDLSKSFVLTSSSETDGGSTYNNDDYIRARLTSSTNLEVSGLGNPANAVSWQVIEYDGASVQRGTGSLTTTTTSTTAAISAVDLTKSIVLLSWKTNIDGTGANFLSARFTSTTQLTITRAVNTSATIDFAWQVVSFTDATVVQSGTLSFDSATTSKTATLTALNLNTSVPLLSTAAGMWGGTHAFSSDDRIGPGMFTTVLTNSTTLTATRSLTGSVAADIAWFVIQFQPVYNEKLQAWSATTADTWETQSLSGYGVPANAVVEIAVRNARATNARYGGVRAVGSSLDRRLLLNEASGGGVDVLVMHAQADSSSQIQHYSDVTADVDFVLLGYWTCGTYVETFDTFTAGANTTWTDKSLCSYGVGPGHIAEIVMTNDDTGNEREAGVRANGSSLSRKLNIHQATGGGVDTATMFVEADTSSTSTIEVYAQDDTDVDFYLVGYWSEAPLSYTELFTDVGSPSSSATWEDKDLTASGISDTAHAEFVLANEDTGNERNLGIRENGSALSRYLNNQEANGGGADFSRMQVASDVTATVEWYHSNIGSANSYYLVGTWSSCTSSTSYVITDLGAITAGNSSLGWRVNSSGKVAGFEESSAGNPTAWLLNCGTFTALGTLGGSYAEAHGINDSNRVVGWSHNASGKRRAFTYSGGTMTDLGIVSGRTDSEAQAVNASDQVVGTVFNFANPAYNRLAFIYLPVGAYSLSAGMNSLGTLGGTQSQAFDINDSGQVVGGAHNASGYYRPFRWQTGTMTNLGTLGGESKVSDHRAESINTSGYVCGRSYTAGGAKHAFFWNGSMTDLGVLTGGTESWAFGINESQQVVGTSDVTGGAFHAFVWDSINGMQDLNDLISGSSGWTLTRATDINDDGVITGWGTNGSGRVRAFLLTPSCKEGGGAAAVESSIVASGSGSTNATGVFDQVVTDSQGAELAAIELVTPEVGAQVHYEVSEPVVESDNPSTPGATTLVGFSDGKALARRLKVVTSSSAADGSILTVSLRFTLEEIAALDATPSELQIHVLDSSNGGGGTWVPAGVNIGVSLPTNHIGESGRTIKNDGSVEYWCVRDSGGEFAVGKASDDRQATRPTPRGCGAGMIPSFLCCAIALTLFKKRGPARKG